MPAAGSENLTFQSTSRAQWDINSGLKKAYMQRGEELVYRNIRQRRKEKTLMGLLLVLEYQAENKGAPREMVLTSCSNMAPLDFPIMNAWASSYMGGESKNISKDHINFCAYSLFMPLYSQFAKWLFFNTSFTIILVKKNNNNKQNKNENKIDMPVILEWKQN